MYSYFIQDVIHDAFASKGMLYRAEYIEETKDRQRVKVKYH